jgi:hypothetical protein
MKTAMFRLRLQHCLILLSLCACGRAKEAEAPSSLEPGPDSGQKSMSGSTDAEPQTLAEAEDMLARARADLDQVALNEPGAPPATAEEKRAESEAAAPRAKEVSPCETACRAFSSLERASDAVCRLDNEGGQRCQRARQIREDAARRVQSCGCSK